jgi:hypothetical protein
MLTLAECAAAAGDQARKVVYHVAPGATGETGWVSSVNGTYVFVRFGADSYSKACRPQDLEWATS